MAGFEASAEETPFTSKFDAVQAGTAKFTAQEKAGYDLFRGKAQCNNCHRDGGPGEDPLFTDFTAINIGSPANPRLPFYQEDRPDGRGYVANPAGPSYIDGGVGTFLANGPVLSHPSAVDARWRPLAQGNFARVQVPTLRNVAVRAPYFHNGAVPTVYHVLNSTARPTRFTRSFSTDRDAYDSALLGWKFTNITDSCADTPAPAPRRVYDTTKPGRSNRGHTFGDHLSEAERMAIIEYLKTL